MSSKQVSDEKEAETEREAEDDLKGESQDQTEAGRESHDEKEAVTSGEKGDKSGERIGVEKSKELNAEDLDRLENEKEEEEEEAFEQVDVVWGWKSLEFWTMSETK